MIKTLRRKFIRISMLSVTAVLVLLMGAVNAANFYSVVQTADERLELIRREQDFFPDEQDFVPDPDQRLPLLPEPSDTEEGRKVRGRLNEEARFDTRFFTVTFNANGVVTAINTGRIAAVDSETAEQMALRLYEKGKTSGFTGTYRYIFDPLTDGTRCVFVDCARELSTFQSFLTASVLVSLLGLLLVFVLVLFFSKKALRPVEESINKQKRFITDASHEIKTPLAVISAANEVIELENGESEWTESIGKQIRRLTSLTDKLVQLSRMDEESFRPNVLRFDLTKAVEETALSFEAVAKARNRALSADVQPGLEYLGDEAAIRQLVSLLTDNALKYSDDGGFIRIRLKKSGKGSELTVENSTDGVEQGDLSVLFERFYRADKSRSSATGGHGIGLSVAKAIVTAHKGKITAFSPDGKRVIFTVNL